MQKLARSRLKQKGLTAVQKAVIITSIITGLLWYAVFYFAGVLNRVEIYTYRKPIKRKGE